MALRNIVNATCLIACNGLHQLTHRQEKNVSFKYRAEPCAYSPWLLYSNITQGGGPCLFYMFLDSLQSNCAFSVPEKEVPEPGYAPKMKPRILQAYILVSGFSMSLSRQDGTYDLSFPCPSKANFYESNGVQWIQWSNGASSFGFEISECSYWKNFFHAIEWQK